MAQVKSFLNDLRIEFGICLRSGWTLAMMLLLLALTVFTVWNSYSLIASQVPIISNLKDYFGTDLQSWLAGSPDAENYRNAILAANPANSANLILTSCGGVGAFIFTIWSAFVVGNDFHRQTASTRAAHFGWAKVVWCKLIVIALVAAIAVFVALIGGTLFSHVLWQFILKDFSLAGTLVPDTSLNIFAGYITIVLGFWLFSALATVVMLLVKKLPLSVIIILIITSFEMSLYYWWLPMHAFLNIQTGMFTYFVSSATTLSPTTGPVSGLFVWAIMIAWLLAAVVASHLIARKQSI